MRTAPIVPLPQQTTPDTIRLVDALSRSLGFVVPLLDLTLVSVEAGLSVTGTGGGVVVLSSTSVVDWNDTGIDEVRLVGYGRDSTSSGATLAYRVGGVVLAVVTVPQGAAAVFSGAWTRVSTAQRTTIAGDHTAQLAVVGNGVNAVLLTRVGVQLRTVQRVV